MSDEEKDPLLVKFATYVAKENKPPCDPKKFKCIIYKECIQEGSWASCGVLFIEQNFVEEIK